MLSKRCSRGHDDIRIEKNGQRACRVCQRDAMRRWRAKNPKRDRRNLLRWRAKNPKACSEAQKRFYKKRPKRCAEITRKYRYGIEPEEWNIKFEAQGKRCAICNTDGKKFKKGPGHGWRTDHDHKTGKFRGILCHPCNVSIGMAQDDPKILQRAAQYLLVNT